MSWSFTQSAGHLRQGRNLIVVPNWLSTDRDANLIVVMADGESIENGTHGTLTDAGGTFARLVKPLA